MALKLKNLHILVIEDVQPMRELTSAILKAQGVGTVSYAADGKRGFEAFCRLRPDIILTDWQMPEMDGLELTKLIRTSPNSPDKTVPIIMMTGYGSPVRITNARNMGVTEFLVKPFSAHDISKRILNVIQSPRDFIVTSTFAGPDRRRKKDIGMSPDGHNQRSNPKGYLEIIKANHLLQAKVGMGNADEEKLAKAQSIIDKNNIDFVPIAKTFLQEFREALNYATAEEYTNRRSIERIINPVMQLKANSKVFKYSLLGDLSSIMLNFLEGLNELDDDAFSIVEAHYKTLTHIINEQMQGDGGDDGKSFEKELEAACRRYTNSRISRQREALSKILMGQAK